MRLVKQESGGMKEGSEILGCHGVLQYYRLEHNVTQAKCATLSRQEEIVLGPLNVTFIGMSRVRSQAHTGCDPVQCGARSEQSFNARI